MLLRDAATQKPNYKQMSKARGRNPFPRPALKSLVMQCSHLIQFYPTYLNLANRFAVQTNPYEYNPSDALIAVRLDPKLQTLPHVKGDQERLRGLSTIALVEKLDHV